MYALVYCTLAVFILNWAARFEAVGLGSALARFGFAYAGCSLFLAGLVYGLKRPSWFGKQPRTGRISLWSQALFGAYFGLIHGVLEIYCRVTREPAFCRVEPNLYLGRRLGAVEASRLELWTQVVDLTSEFAGSRPFRQLPSYYCLPVLDGSFPKDEELRAVASRIQEFVQTGPTYVHCALGHGRSVMAVLAYWLLDGQIAEVEEGLRRIRQLRPAVRLRSGQVAALNRIKSSLESLTLENARVE